MRSFSYYLSYWPVLMGALLFLGLGLWWHLIAARAMELSPKPLSWVRNYRRAGFPFRREILGRPHPKALAIWTALLLGLAFPALHVAVNGQLISGQPWIYFRYSYGWLRLALRGAGAAAVFFLLSGLFDSSYTALLGALLFCASPSRAMSAGSVTAVILLLLFLYLKTEKPGFPAELLYLGAMLAMAPLLVLAPGAAWLILVLMPVHWYKLLGLHRESKLRGKTVALVLVLSILGWGLMLVLAALLRRFYLAGFRFRELAALMTPLRIRYACSELVQGILVSLLRLPTRGMAVDLLADAVLLGLGFWGCFAAWTMAAKRRNVRGVFALAVLGVLTLVWLISGQYLMTLGLVLTTACILKNTDLGSKRPVGLVLVLAGLCYDLFLLLAPLEMAIPAGLQERLF